MSSRETDLQFVKAGVEDLPDYLLSKELFWPLSAPRFGYSLPRFTLGGLLAALRRLQAYADAPAKQAEIRDFERRVDAFRTSRRVAWEAKAAREFGVRFRLWQNYLSDLRRDPETHADAYAHEVSWRVLLELLAAELPVPPPESSALSGLDSVLKSYWHPGGFIWEPELKPVFPEQPFWYLYGNVRS
ncbi:MAG: hypothetical protein AB1846_01840 [Chloroflexota bacterium]